MIITYNYCYKVVRVNDPLVLLSLFNQQLNKPIEVYMKKKSIKEVILELIEKFTKPRREIVLEQIQELTLEIEDRRLKSIDSSDLKLQWINLVIELDRLERK